MTGRRILMLVNFFPPAAGGGVYRTLSFIKYLTRLSWEVTVVTPKPGEFWISDPALLGQVPECVRVVRTSSLSGFRVLNRLKGSSVGGRASRRSSALFASLRRIGEFLLVPDTYVGWVPFAFRAARRLCRSERFDVLYSTSPPDSTHLAAARVARMFSLPWVADFRDPWVALHLRRPPTPLHRALHAWMEGRAVAADRVLVTSSWHERLLREGRPGCRVERIPNGYDEEEFEGLEELAPPETPFTITHCGMLTLGRSSRPFLEGLSILLERHPEIEGRIRVDFIGPRESENERHAERLGLGEAIAFCDNISHVECLMRERTSHVLLLIKHDDERYRGLVPGKLFEYLGARRPILAVAPEGEASSIVSSLNRGETVEIAAPDEIAGRIWEMYLLYREGKLDRRYSLGSLTGYSRREQAEKLNGILDRLLEGK